MSRRDIPIDVFCFGVPSSSDLFLFLTLENARVKHLGRNPFSNNSIVIRCSQREIFDDFHLHNVFRSSRVPFYHLLTSRLYFLDDIGL